jgi:TPR repeat protein
MRIPVLLLFLVCISPLTYGQSTAFNEAQVAASEGRYEAVVTILTRALESGELDDANLAIAYSNRGIANSLLQHYPEAVSDLQNAYKLNPDHLLTLNHLGILAEHVELDLSNAAAWYERAASLGYAASQVNLGNLLRDGRGVERDPFKAVQLYRLAVNQNYPAALVSLGEMYIEGNGVKPDYAQGIALLKKGVDQGVVTGNFYLGVAYERGKGVPQSFELAKAYYETAAIQGHAPSQGALGYLHRRGNGVPKNFIEAARWYRLAADQGDVKAANRLAWLLATCPIPEICNGEVALEFAKLAVSTDRSASHLDSLAAAYARIGEFDEALVIINEIITQDALTVAMRAKYARRLQRYQNGIPYQL